MHTNLYHVRLCSSVVTFIVIHFVLCVCCVGLVEGFNQTSVLSSSSLNKGHVFHFNFCGLPSYSFPSTEICLRYAVSVSPGALPVLHPFGTGTLLSQGMKQPKADRSVSSSPEIFNAWCYKSTPSDVFKECLGIRMDRCAFAFELSFKHTEVLYKLLTCHSRLRELMNVRVM